jgi:hypothetical protein
MLGHLKRKKAGSALKAVPPFTSNEKKRFFEKNQGKMDLDILSPSLELSVGFERTLSSC